MKELFYCAAGRLQYGIFTIILLVKIIECHLSDIAQIANKLMVIWQIQKYLLLKSFEVQTF